MNPYYDSSNPNNWQQSQSSKTKQEYPSLNSYQQNQNPYQPNSYTQNPNMPNQYQGGQNYSQNNQTQHAYQGQTHHGHHGHHGHHNHHGHHQEKEDSKIVIIIEKKEEPVHTNPVLLFSAHSNQSHHHKSLFNPLQQYMFVTELDHSLCLDVSEDPNTIGELLLWKKHEKKNQRFRIVQRHGKYSIISCATLNVLTVKNHSHHKGAHIATFFDNGQKSQVWQFHHVPGKTDRYLISNGFGQYLDVFESKAKKGTPVIQYQYNGNKNQIWHLVPV